ncbi:unnamed protein product [Cuscuta europaea]|uniref:Uncharacterized protein n=1 Tax=Cuscuta europaea TaxID=41803 RepID=A0A9P1EIU8_CUSEU|nr:unnamed protein product [Cuscuta europaea]
MAPIYEDDKATNMALDVTNYLLEICTGLFKRGGCRKRQRRVDAGDPPARRGGRDNTGGCCRQRQRRRRAAVGGAVRCGGGNVRCDGDGGDVKCDCGWWRRRSRSRRRWQSQPKAVPLHLPSLLLSL